MTDLNIEKPIKQRDLESCWAPDTDLANKTTLGVGVETDLYFHPVSLGELHRIRELARQLNREIIPVGGGSNVLFTDRATEQFLVEFSEDRFSYFRMDQQGERYRVEAGAGQTLPSLVRKVTDRGWETFGRLTGIPGTVGGALYGNAGTGKAEIGDFVSEVYVLHPDQPEVMEVEEPRFEYRWSNLQDQIILKAVLEGDNRPEDLEDPPFDRIQEHRMDSQPISERSAGCMFKNPDNDSAGRLIDEAGLKGFQVGGARVSEVHANFVINEGDASPGEVLTLLETIEERVEAEKQVQLEREIQVI